MTTLNDDRLRSAPHSAGLSLGALELRGLGDRRGLCYIASIHNDVETGVETTFLDGGFDMDVVPKGYRRCKALERRLHSRCKIRCQSVYHTKTIEKDQSRPVAFSGGLEAYERGACQAMFGHDLPHMTYCAALCDMTIVWGKTFLASSRRTMTS